MGNDSNTFDPKPKTPEWGLRVVCLKRCARSGKGGRRFTFSALVVVGDGCGRVGLALGKSGEVADAIRKAEEAAAGQIVKVSLQSRTIPHEVSGHYCGANVLLRPAVPGTGIIACSTVRAILELVGVKDVMGKSSGAGNVSNLAKATLQALMTLRLPERIYADRGLKMKKAKFPLVIGPGAFDLGQNPLHLN